MQPADVYSGYLYPIVTLEENLERVKTLLINCNFKK